MEGPRAPQQSDTHQPAIFNVLQSATSIKERFGHLPDQIDERAARVRDQFAQAMLARSLVDKGRVFPMKSPPKGLKIDQERWEEMRGEAIVRCKEQWIATWDSAMGRWNRAHSYAHNSPKSTPKQQKEARRVRMAFDVGGGIGGLSLGYIVAASVAGGTKGAAAGTCMCPGIGTAGGVFVGVMTAGGVVVGRALWSQYTTRLVDDFRDWKKIVAEEELYNLMHAVMAVDTVSRQYFCCLTGQKPYVPIESSGGRIFDERAVSLSQKTKNGPGSKLEIISIQHRPSGSIIFSSDRSALHPITTIKVTDLDRVLKPLSLRRVVVPGLTVVRSYRVAYAIVSRMRCLLEEGFPEEGISDPKLKAARKTVCERITKTQTDFRGKALKQIERFVSGFFPGRSEEDLEPIKTRLRQELNLARAGDRAVQFTPLLGLLRCPESPEQVNSQDDPDSLD